MNYAKKILKIAIIIMVLICIIITILLIKNHKKENSESVISSSESTEGDEEVEYKVEEVKDPTKFFSVENCIQKDENSEFMAKEMYLKEGETIFTYVVYGSNEYYIVRVDIDSLQYTIEKIEEQEYKSMKQGNIKTKGLGKDAKEEFEYITITEEDMCRIYLERFNQLQIENSKEAYELIEETYKKERFSSYSDYEEYVDQLKNQLEEGVLSKYAVEYFDDYTEYTIVDVYNRSYTINATGVMNYKIKLDNYTIKTADYEKNYEKLDEQEKVVANVYIFLQMINTKDYKHAYELLDETFKKNNFATLEEFKNYANENFFIYNIDSDKGKTGTEGKYYTYQTEISESNSSAAEKKELTIIMQLEEGTDFVMSFSLK